MKLVKRLHVSAAIELLSFPMGSFGFVCLNFAKRYQIADKNQDRRMSMVRNCSPGFSVIQLILDERRWYRIQFLFKAKTRYPYHKQRVFWYVTKVLLS